MVAVQHIPEKAIEQK